MVFIGVHPLAWRLAPPDAPVKCGGDTYRLDRELWDFDHGGQLDAVVTGKQDGCMDGLVIGLFRCSGRFCGEEDIPRSIDIGRTRWIADVPCTSPVPVVIQVGQAKTAEPRYFVVYPDICGSDTAWTASICRGMRTVMTASRVVQRDATASGPCSAHTPATFDRAMMAPTGVRDACWARHGCACLGCS